MSDVIDVFGPASGDECAGTRQARSLRPASRDLSDGARSGNTNPQGRTKRTEVRKAWRPSVRHAELALASGQNLLFTMYQNRQTTKSNAIGFFYKDDMIFRKPPSASERDNAHQEGYGGACRDRTDDPLLAKQVLSQLS